MTLSVFVFVFCLILSTAVFAENITITLWDILTESEALTPALKDAIARFEEDHPNVKINHIPTQNDDYKTKLRIAMGANNEPDIFMTWGSESLKMYIDEGKVYNLSSHMKEGWLDNFAATALDLGTFNGDCYGIPVQGITPALLWYRTDIFEKYNLKAPETYEELLTVVKILKSSGITPFALANKTMWTGMEYYMYLIDRIGGAEAFPKALNRKGAFNDEPFIETGRRIQELVNMGAFPEGVNGLDENAGQSRMLLYTDKAAMYLIGTWSYGIMKQENEAILDKLDLINFPAIEGGKGDPSNLMGASGSNFYSIASSSKHKKEAVEFLKYLSDAKMAQAVLNSGNMTAVAGVKDLITDPFIKKIYEFGQQANSVQPWYDQVLPLELAEVHLNTTQALFGNRLTPEEAANKMEAAAQEYFGE